jgi:hypothetical protein
MARNAFFDDVLREMGEVHDRKNEDYAADGDPFSNFTGVAQMTGQPVDMVFFTMIGIKIMRLKELVGVGKDPNFESIDDTILDLANYAAIWKAYRLRTTAYEAGEYYTQGNTEASPEEGVI